MFVRRTIENNEEAGIRLKIGVIFSRSMVLEAISGFQSYLKTVIYEFQFILITTLLGWDEKHTKDSLIQFVKQYDNCLGSREQREREFDAVDFHTVIPCATKSSIEAQFQYVYTHEKFRKVQTQFRGNVNCITRSTQSVLGYTVYEVVEQVSNLTFNRFVVTYDAISYEVKCQCLLFESKDILCHHSLSVLSFEQVDKVALRYILERWSKNSNQEKPLLEPKNKRFDDLVFHLHNICEFASEFEELIEILHQTFDNVMAEMQEYQVKSKSKCSLSHEDATLNDINDLQSSPCVRTRERPKNRLG
ncbi:hypothetical protein Ahy_A05g022319 isoform A [Arachis hypogaea]|uniref:Protein FAR1-RELATED SEQUENCE n=1 Tax=Arachis hypogaea TaxID=3818 RepID=A0A445D0G1_ARAHY|nr:hypothetical protein Ahy_A05g022319 isoform A [Arachis hypogaea]